MLQDTGLKDKNGKKIYEYDIIKVDGLYFKRWNDPIDIKYEDYIGMVWHADNMPCFYIGNLLKNVIPRTDLAEKHYEVIGNKFENVELLGD